MNTQKLWMNTSKLSPGNVAASNPATVANLPLKLGNVLQKF